MYIQYGYIGTNRNVYTKTGLIWLSINQLKRWISVKKTARPEHCRPSQIADTQSWGRLSTDTPQECRGEVTHDSTVRLGVLKHRTDTGIASFTNHAKVVPFNWTSIWQRVKIHSRSTWSQLVYSCCVMSKRTNRTQISEHRVRGFVDLIRPCQVWAGGRRTKVK